MFNGIWLVASEPVTVQGREVEAGERFQCSRIYSGALLVMGRATIAPKLPPAPSPDPPAPRRRGRPRKITTAVVTAETDGEPAIDTPKRSYRRRDLEAEP